MPSMANITVKKNDGTTDVIYMGVQPSAGDKSPAVWQNQSVGSAVAHRPEFRTVAQDNGTNTARRVNMSYMYPSLVTGSDGRISVADKVTFNGSFSLPKAMPQVDTNEAAVQLANLIASALVKEMLKSGYSAS